MNFLDELNPAQKEAVVNTNGPSLVIAGAGSGKTRVLTFRIAQLLKLGVPANHILALTFTNKAAREMKERIASIVGPQTAKYLWMGTFHSVFSKILRYEAEHLGYTSNYSIYDSADSKSLIKSIIKELNLDEKQYKPNEVLHRISGAKNNLITPSVYNNNTEIIAYDRASKKPRLNEIYVRYWSKCKQSDAMDFDDLLLNTNILFRDFPHVLQAYQERFDYILVDEYQDTNFSQYLIIKKLAEQHKNICVVGDDAQSIYSFRGAKIENILNFKNDYPNYRLYKLEQNYRSTQTIVNAANSLIANNNKQIQKKVFSQNEVGEKIKIIRSLTDTEEGFMIANQITDRRNSEQLAYMDFAVLYRTNAQSRIIEEALRKKNIPYKLYGSISFYQRKEIKDLLSYFRLIINHNDDEALKRIVNFPARGIGKTTMDAITSYAGQHSTSCWNVISSLSTNDIGLRKNTIQKLFGFTALIKEYSSLAFNEDAYAFATKLAKSTGILKEFKESNAPEDISKYENLQELLNGIREFVSGNQDNEAGIPTIAQYMENVALLTDQDNDKDENKDKVTLMTVHSSKGLEFKHIYISGLEEKLFPSQMSSGTEKELEEERRLFYVALTRAEKTACLSWSKTRYKYGVPEDNMPSRFLKEIDAEFVEMGYASGFGSANGFRRSTKNTYKKINVPIGQRNPLDNGYKSVNQSREIESDPNFKADNPALIQAGMNIEHQRFGKGKVIQIEGKGSNQKALVFFQSVGEKQLLLKFAKLKIV